MVVEFGAVDDPGRQVRVVVGYGPGNRLRVEGATSADAWRVAVERAREFKA